MTLARTLCVALVGVGGHLVEVEADIASGLPGLTLIGLPDAALHEARDRIRAAIVNSGEHWPNKKITVGLFPATLPKSGSGFDASMAAAVLCAATALPPAALACRVLLGELALDGRLRPLRGVLPSVLAAAREGVERVVVPAANRAEASLVPGVTVEAVHDFRGLVRLLRGQRDPEEALATDPPATTRPDPVYQLDLAEVAGQSRGRQAVEVSAAGGHHLYLLGAPGSGKTMLAERLPGLLPSLDEQAALEVTAIHSVAGVLPAHCPLVVRPPFRSPHHTATTAALVGGGSTVLKPGLASQAHRGVLFLDEAAEFSASALDALRQPLESGVIEVSRARTTARYPARFTLVMAANPVPVVALEARVPGRASALRRFADDTCRDCRALCSIGSISRWLCSLRRGLSCSPTGATPSVLPSSRIGWAGRELPPGAGSPKHRGRPTRRFPGPN